jgi:serine/threonine protein kinase
MTPYPYIPGPGDLPPQFGPYDVLAKIGKGGMASVYLVRDPRLERQTALKVSRYSESHRPDLLKRFYYEARAAGRLQHPNLCPVYEVGAIDGVHYLTMPYLEGQTLASLVPSYVGAPQAAAGLVETLAWAVAFAHARDVVHRDLKPVNIMMVGRDRLQPVIVDFGVALRLDAEDERETLAGQIIGTVAYMAPEQHAGEPELAGPTCDIYSLGVVLYELLTGAPPFDGSVQRVRDKKLRAEYRPLREASPEAGPALDAICRRALAPLAADRYPSMAAFAQALAEVSLSPKLPRRPVSHVPAEERGTAAAAPEPRVPTPSTVLPDLFTVVGRSMRSGKPQTMPADGWQVPEEVLGVLRRLGWEERLTQLRATIDAIENPRQRGLLQLYAGWLAGERGGHVEAIELLTAAAQVPELAAWAYAGMAIVRLRDRQYADAHALLDRATAASADGDAILRATLAHARGSVLLKEQRFVESLEHLYAALAGFGPDHFGTGRVLDTLGMAYAFYGDDFTTAYRFYRRALTLKDRHQDQAGLAVTHGQLGRLCLDWGEVDWAEEHFRKDLEICRRINDRRGEAQMYNHLGQVCLARGRLRQALDFLDESVRRSAAIENIIGEAYARKDRARVLVQMNRAADAEADARRAEEMFAGPGFLEGTWHARRALALARAAQGDDGEAERILCRAAAYFDDFNDTAEAARTWLDLARVRRLGGLRTEALEAALERAELSRRDSLLMEVEAELRDADEVGLYRRLYRRARGRGIREDTT